MKSLENSQIHQVITLLEDYLNEIGNSKTPVVDYIPGNELKSKFVLENDNALSMGEYLDEIKNYLKYSVRTTHPLCNNQLFAGINPESIIAELLTVITNTTMATYEMAPVATLMEQELIKKINEILGFNHGDGIMLTGGSNANLMAIHLARHKKFPDTKHSGNENHKFAIFVSDQAHYSHQKAVMLMGMGLESLISVKSNSAGQMDPEDLEAKILHAKTQGREPLLVCSTAGTTVMGAFDPIDRNSEICKQYGLWHHIDGAWGGAVMFSSKYKKLLQDTSKVDSFTFDAHKTLATGVITSFFLTNHKGLLEEANSAGGSTYIFHNYENSDFDTGPKSLQCGRKNDALKMWLTWKSRGAIGLENIVNDLYDKQSFMVQEIKENPRLKLLFEPEYLNVCFQVIPESNVDINRFNFDLRFKVVQSGKLMTNFSSWPDGTVFFRHILANQETTKEDLKKILNTILDMA